jgi:hypothetical protein
LGLVFVLGLGLAYCCWWACGSGIVSESYIDIQAAGVDLGLAIRKTRIDTSLGIPRPNPVQCQGFAVGSVGWKSKVLLTPEICTRERARSVRELRLALG